MPCNKNMWLELIRILHEATFQIKMASGSTTSQDKQEEDASELQFPKGSYIEVIIT